MARAHLLAVLLILALPFVPGCTDGPTAPSSDDGTGNGEARTYEECDAIVVPFEANGTQWEAGRISCDANVPGKNTVNPTCGQPDEAGLSAAANLTSGHVQLVVEDGTGERIVDHRLEDTDGEARQVAVPSGEAGDWTLTGERLEVFEGTYRAELACPT